VLFCTPRLTLFTLPPHDSGWVLGRFLSLIGPPLRTNERQARQPGRLDLALSVVGQQSDIQAQVWGDSGPSRGLRARSGRRCQMRRVHRTRTLPVPRLFGFWAIGSVCERERCHTAKHVGNLDRFGPPVDNRDATRCSRDTPRRGSGRLCPHIMCNL